MSSDPRKYINTEVVYVCACSDEEYFPAESLYFVESPVEDEVPTGFYCSTCVDDIVEEMEHYRYEKIVDETGADYELADELYEQIEPAKAGIRLSELIGK